MAVAVVGYLAGMVPGDSVRATVDHCYVTYDRQEQRHSRCVGQWTRAGRAVSGPVHGVDVGRQWQVLTVDPDPNFEWEVTIPRSARRQAVVANQTRAYVVPAFVPVLLMLLALLAVAFLAWKTRRRGGWPKLQARRLATG
ncbi:hypothetical protein [Micromonospora kangleipakensis]|uniref:hypothetical protein n=1 Tax=Micromonospora kangleipakensis TaxID=1077942 RepID=UPI001028B535|nr:hypothetical protein [Micromonospora kangleipakensis]